MSPFLYAGPGVLLFADDSPEDLLQRWDAFFKLKFGAGLEYSASDRISVTLKGEWNSVFSDKIDNLDIGRRDDFYWNFGLGINYHFGSKEYQFKINK